MVGVSIKLIETPTTLFLTHCNAHKPNTKVNAESLRNKNSDKHIARRISEWLCFGYCTAMFAGKRSVVFTCAYSWIICMDIF